MDRIQSKKRTLVDAQGNPRGGRQQRKEIQAALASEAPSSSSNAFPSTGFLIDSSAALDYLKQFAEGGISATEVQHRAHQDYKDQIRLLDNLGMHHGHVLSSIKKLAALGSWGRLKGNVAKELRILLGEPQTPMAQMHKLNARIEKPRMSLPFFLQRLRASFLAS